MGTDAGAGAGDQVARLQQQVEDLRKHWQMTHEKEHAEYQAQLLRKEQRNQELQMEIEGMKARQATMSPPNNSQIEPKPSAGAPVPPLAMNRVQSQRSAPPPPRPLSGRHSAGSAEAMMSPGSTRGVIGMKISNTPPHHVLSVTELMNETGAIVNEAVGLGDELTAIEKVPVRSMPVGDVVRHVAGPAGTLVHLTFRNPRTDQIYSIVCQRHHPLTPRAAAPSPSQEGGQIGGSAPPARPYGALEASAPGPIQQVKLSQPPHQPPQ